jgi:RHS repeat-associated protein
MPQVVQPLLSECSVTSDSEGADLTFVYRVESGQGGLQDNRLSVVADWMSGWQDAATSYQAVTAPVKVSASATALPDWFDEAAGAEASATAGRGAVNLSWPADPFALGYRVYLYDGAWFRQVATTTATSWSTLGKKLYPSDSAIASLPADYAGGFPVSRGLDLRDDPRPLYAKTPGTLLDRSPAYSFKVVPFNDAGSAYADCRGVPVALPGRTKHRADAPRHTVVDLGKVAADDVRARADVGDLLLSATDLSIPGVGPDVEVSRAYRSSLAASTLAAPGWRFGFERSIVASGTSAVYCDEAGGEWTFRKVSGGWVAPHGSADILAGDSSSGFTLSRKDRSVIAFDASGRLAFETDAFGNAVRYEWSGDGSSLVIRSPKDVPFLHERRITVTFSAGKVVKAVAHVGGSDEDRVATYASAAGSFTVKRLAGTDAELTTQYGYDDAKRIRTVSVPGFTPSSDGAAHWSVSYPPAGGIVLANETGGGTPRAPLAVMPGGNAGTALVVSASGTSTLAFSPLGEQIASTAENTSVATFHDYDVEGFRIAEKTPLGRTTSAVYDERGNAIAETDESGGVTSRQFEGDLCTKETDARGAVTVRSYDAATGALLSEECTLNDEGDKSHVDYAYNGDGTLSRERKAITETLTAQTNYADYADCGNAQKTTQVGVEVAPGVIRDLVARASYDGFGDQLSVQDAEGVVVERNSYDPAGRLIESIDASDTVEHTRYGLLGEQCSRWESNPATSTRAAWVDTVSNAAGEPIVEVTRASNGTTVSAVTHRYDTAGREVATDDSTVPGAEVTKYDGQGNVAQVWDEGSNTSLSSASTRSEFNAEGEEIRSTQPGATTASTDTSYTADGAVARVSEAEAASVRCAYDESGDLSQQTVSTDAGDASTVMENDLVGRPVDEVDCDGTRETIEYDLDGNEVGRALGDEAESLTRVNTLGWTLVDVDADGALSRSSYDLDGRLVAETVGASSSQSRYDGCGRLSQQVGRDGIVADHAYDCFGSEVLRTETSGTILLKATATSYDGAHRIATETITDASGTTLRSYTYAPDGRQTVAESRRGGSIVTTSVSDGTDAAVCCSSTILGRSFSWSVSATDAAGRTTTLESTGLPSAQRSVWTQTGKPSSSRLGSATADYTYSAVSGRKSAESFHFAFGGRTESWSYGYDLAGRLSTATLNGVPTVYRYDPASGSLLSVKSGNATMTALSYEASGTDRLVSAGDGRYAFDDQGRRIAAQNDRYEWSGDTLAVVRTSRGTAAYTYDSQGQRTGSAVASGSLSTATRYEYDEDRLQSLTATRSDGATWSVDYAYDDGGVLLGGVYRTRSDALWFVAETTGRGDVRELMTSDGRAFAFYGYDAYGKPSATLTTATPSVSATVAADIAVRQPVRYGGYVFDAESGLYYCMARYYDPATAAFISKDPDRSDGQQSAFQYCSDDPIDAVDPTGCDVWGYGKYGDAFYRKTTSSSRSKKSKKAERTLVKYCRSRVGGRYVFGAKAKRGKEWRKGPLDCSGLTAAAYRVAHKVDKRTFRNIPDGSYNQHDSSRSLGFKRKASKLKIGDLGFLHYGGTKRGRVHHVGIYIGRSVVIEARGKKWGVVKTSLAAFNKRGADWHRARKH